jgi:tetratricopeptide (TPR) repeat protein
VLCTSLVYGPTPADEAVVRCEEMLGHKRESRVVEANISISLAGLLAMLGRFDEARAYAEQSKSVYGELGQTLAVAGWTQIAGPMELLAANPAAAEQHLRLGLDLLADAGSQDYQASLLADALYQLGSYDEAVAFAELALAQSDADDDAAREIASGVRAKVQASLRPDQLEEAFATARAAAELAAATDALNLWGDSLVSVAHVLHCAGRDDEAGAVLQEAADVYRRKGNVVAAEVAVGGAAQLAG